MSYYMSQSVYLSMCVEGGSREGMGTCTCVCGGGPGRGWGHVHVCMEWDLRRDGGMCVEGGGHIGTHILLSGCTLFVTKYI